MSRMGNSHPRLKKIRKERQARLNRLLCQFRCMDYWASKRKHTHLRMENKMFKKITDRWKGLTDYDKIDVVGIAAVTVLVMVLFTLMWLK